MQLIETLWLRFGPYMRMLTQFLEPLLSSGQLDPDPQHHHLMLDALKSCDAATAYDALFHDIRSTHQLLHTYCLSVDIVDDSILAGNSSSKVGDGIMNILKLSDPVVQAAHDAQFKLDSISDLEAVMERRTKAAEVGLATFEVRQYIPYGARPEETLNLFPARRAQGLAPVQVFIHGGFWRSMRADQFSFLARGFRSIRRLPCHHRLSSHSRRAVLETSWPLAKLRSPGFIAMALIMDLIQIASSYRVIQQAVISWRNSSTGRGSITPVFPTMLSRGRSDQRPL